MLGETRFANIYETSLVHNAEPVVLIHELESTPGRQS